MKLVLFAYRDVGYECLKYLIRIKCLPSLVIIPEDERKKSNIFKLVSNLAEKYNIKLLYYSNQKAHRKILFEIIKRIDPEYGISTYFPFIIENRVIKLFKYGVVNIHGGLLPNYRGTFSSVWSIINNEKYTGASLHYIDAGIDTGNIIKVKRCIISKKDTGYTLYLKVSKLSFELFREYIFMILNKKRIISKKQKIVKNSYYSRKLPNNGEIIWHAKSKDIYNFCRALYFPGFKFAIAKYKKQEIQISSVKVMRTKSQFKPGKATYINKKKMRVCTLDYDILAECKKLNFMFKNKKEIQL